MHLLAGQQIIIREHRALSRKEPPRDAEVRLPIQNKYLALEYDTEFRQLIIFVGRLLMLFG